MVTWGRDQSQTISLKPIDGWGFLETVDGQLAPSFGIALTSEGSSFGDRIRGWKAKAINGKYAGAYLELTPRHLEWTGVVVVEIFDNEHERNILFSGMAESRNLRPGWK